MYLYVQRNACLNKDVMKTLLNTALVAIFILSTNILYAQEFTHFKLKGELRNAVIDPSPKSARGVLTASVNRPKINKAINKIVAEKILNLDLSGNSIVDDELPPLLKKIADIMGTRYNEIGQEQTQPLLLNHDIGGGVMNFSGFTWNKPMASFGLWANREIAPDLFSDRWIVHDTLLLRISAQTLLSNLKEADLIDIEEDAIGAFAGISFQRTYHYYHFAESYVKGLTADYSKLFMSFAKFSLSNSIDLPPYELMKKKDEFSFNVGGFANTPPWNGISARAGVLVKAAFENELTIQSLGEADQRNIDEFLRVSVDKSWDVSADAHLSLQIDFFNLLKLTLLSYDLEYSFGKSNKMHLSFYEKDKELIRNSKEHRKEFRKLVSGVSDKVKLFEDHIVQQDERLRQNLNSKYSVLLLGKIRKKETEQVKVVKDGVEKIFFKHYSQSIKYIQNIWSRLFNNVIYRIFKWNPSIKNVVETNKQLNIEYEETEGINKAQVDSVQKFSIQLVQEFTSGKTHRWIDKRFKKEAVKHLTNWSTVDQGIIDLVASEKLRGPLNLETKIQVETAALEYLHSLSENNVFDVITDVCKTKRKKKWMNPNRRKKMLKRPQFGKSACVKKIGKRYVRYVNKLMKTGFSDITQFRKFLGKFFSKSKNLGDLQRLFGANNVFIYGNFNAKTNEGIPFSTHFKTGLFRGLGVIDNFMRQDGTAAPMKLLK